VRRGAELTPLFATPLVTFEVPEATALNSELRRVIEQREESHPSTQHSYLGGWQSSDDMDRWDSAPAIKLLAIGRNLANRLTIDRDNKPVAMTWRANMWANINRSGHGNAFHVHPGSFWSGVYYVDDGGIADEPWRGGELEFMDPRGPGSVMYAPHLAFAMPGGLYVGATEMVLPESGRLVMFPSWLMHQVRLYRGNAERVSIAFNLSL
jgi:uncharacterized protein (TIGR02466 family)